MIYKIKPSKVRNEKLNVFDVCLHNLALSKFWLKHLFLFQLRTELFSAQRLPNVTNLKLFVSNLQHGENTAPCWVYGWVILTVLLKKSLLSHLINWKEKHFQFSCNQAHSYVRLTAVFGTKLFLLFGELYRKNEVKEQGFIHCQWTMENQGWILYLRYQDGSSRWRYSACFS